MSQQRRSAVSTSNAPAAAGAAPRLHEQIAAILAARIRQGHIPAGSRLRELHVSSEFDVSRAPVRQAFASLAKEGLLVPLRGQGTVVWTVTKVAPVAAAEPPPPAAVSIEVSWERIYKEIEQEIIARTAFASWRVNESALADFYGVSRTVARDVLGRLQQRGVVKKDTRGHWYSPALTADYVAELYAMRRLLEPAALASAADNAPSGLVERLIAEHRDAIARADRLGGDELSALETGLHVELLSACRNRTLVEAIRLYQSLLVAHSFLYRWAPQLYSSEPFLPEHLDILERLAAGDVASAARALERHFEVSLDRAVGRFDRLRREGMPSAVPYLMAMAAG